MHVGDQLQVAEQILDLRAVIKTEAADHVVGDAVAAQGLFHQARLRVGAVEDGAARGVFCLAGSLEVLVDLVGDEDGFGLPVGCLIEPDERAAFARGPQVFALALRVLRDDGAGTFENDLRGAVVLLEADGAGVGELLLEIENVLDVRAAPAVDGLVFVADHADVAVRTEQLHQLVLRAVGVLVLVDQQVTVLAVVALAYLGRGFEQTYGFEQKIVKIERVGLEELVLVDLVDVRDFLFERIRGAEEVFLRVQHVVFGPADTA